MLRLLQYEGLQQPLLCVKIGGQYKIILPCALFLGFVRLFL